MKEKGSEEKKEVNGGGVVHMGFGVGRVKKSKVESGYGERI